MAAPLIVRLVMDAAGYLKTVDSAVASNTKLEGSALRVGEAVQVQSKQSVEASLKATRALEAQIVGYRELAASATASSDVRIRAALLAERAEARLNVQTGLASSLASTSRAAANGERDIGKFARGALAGSGAASSLGRSLAFASTGFIAIAAGSTLIASSIKASLDLAKTQRQVDAQLKTTGKSWGQYGEQIDSADLKLSHISGFTNQELLQGFGYLVRVNGNVSESLKLTSEAADVARGRNISLASAAIALAKAQGGSVTALRRLGIVIPKGVEGMQALAYVQEKFAGQAAAGATVTDKFHASLVNTEEIIGNALLPTFTRLTTEAGDWLAKMNETGRLQRDVNEVVTVAGHVFHTLADAIKVVDKITGGFASTLKFAIGIFLGREVFKAIVAVDKLAASWFGVAASANAAAVAEERATTAGAGAAVAGAGAAAEAGAVARGAGTAAGIGLSELAAPVAIVATGAFLLSQSSNKTYRLANGGEIFQDSSGAFFLTRGGRSVGISRKDAEEILGREGPSIAGSPIITPGLRNIGRGGKIQPGFFAGALPSPTGGASGPFGAATPLQTYAKYAQTISEQLAVANAALTKTTRDDVEAAKQIIARIRRLIAGGHLQGAALVQALQDEASQEGVLDSARQQAAQQAAQIAAAKKAAASSYTTPINIQIAQAQAQLTATNADDLKAARAALADAKRALASGRKNKQGQLAAIQAEVQAKQAIDSLQNQNATTFTLPAKLTLALAREQALGLDQTKTLLAMKAALERALKKAKGNIQEQTDIWNQIYGINQQLGSSAQSAFGDFRKVSTQTLTRGLGLTPAERALLRARLSQLGPGRTLPRQGVGAAGFIIGKDDRPIVIHHETKLDGKPIERSTTRLQQKRRRRNSSQRRGPNAGD